MLGLLKDWYQWRWLYSTIQIVYSEKEEFSNISFQFRNEQVLLRGNAVEDTAVRMGGNASMVSWSLLKYIH